MYGPLFSNSPDLETHPLLLLSQPYSWLSLEADAGTHHFIRQTRYRVTSEVIRWFVLLPKQIGSSLLTCNRANLVTPGCGEGKYSVYCKAPSKENGQLVLKRPECPEGFQGRVFKDSVRERVMEYV